MNKYIFIELEKIQKYIAIILLFFFASCSKKIYILKGNDFDSGDWLLVKSYNANLETIDDEIVLKTNVWGVIVYWQEEDNYTTCDGVYKLYKDGELVFQQNYLTKYDITESFEITQAYKPSTYIIIEPNNESDFNHKWDSLKKINNYYPTRYLSQPANKEIIWLYKY